MWGMRCFASGTRRDMIHSALSPQTFSEMRMPASPVSIYLSNPALVTSNGGSRKRAGKPPMFQSYWLVRNLIYLI